MSYNYYNSNFYNNFTFQGSIGGPPINFDKPPPSNVPHHSDQEYLKSFESKLRNLQRKSQTPGISISQVHKQLLTVVTLIKILKESEAFLNENISVLTESEWKLKMDEIKQNNTLLENLMLQINDTYLACIKNKLVQRAAKRLRQKRVCQKRKQKKQEKLKKRQEISRKIDENLQKIKNENNKAKQEEESKVKSDLVLREVTRKKHDAKKCISKLDALMKLRKARQNTAKGKGMEVSDSDANIFNNNIEKLKSLWNRKLLQYDEEELVLRAKIKKDSENPSGVSNEIEYKVSKNLDDWKIFLFGANVAPQHDFEGNIGNFINIRSQWDQYVNSEGSPLPVGWVLPS